MTIQSENELKDGEMSMERKSAVFIMFGLLVLGCGGNETSSEAGGGKDAGAGAVQDSGAGQADYFTYTFDFRDAGMSESGGPEAGDAGGTGTEVPADGGSGSDAGQADTGHYLPDAGQGDTGNNPPPGQDSGVVEIDGGVQPADSGTEVTDRGTVPPYTDTGEFPAPDGGQPTADGGTGASANYCREYSPQWPPQLPQNPTYYDLHGYLVSTSGNMGLAEVQGNSLNKFRAFLPVGTTKISFSIAHQTAVSTYLIKVDGTPDAADVDVNSSPSLAIYGDCIRNVCPYTKAIYDLYGNDVLINEVKQYCPSFTYPNLICSSPNDLWQGRTFNAVQNTTILQVPADFWISHPDGAWLVVEWSGGIGGNAAGIEVDMARFEAWYNGLTAQKRQSEISCPVR